MFFVVIFTFISNGKKKEYNCNIVEAFQINTVLNMRSTRCLFNIQIPCTTLTYLSVATQGRCYYCLCEKQN